MGCSTTPNRGEGGSSTPKQRNRKTAPSKRREGKSSTTKRRTKEATPPMGGQQHRPKSSRIGGRKQHQPKEGRTQPSLGGKAFPSSLGVCCFPLLFLLDGATFSPRYVRVALLFSFLLVLGCVAFLPGEKRAPPTRGEGEGVSEMKKIDQCEWICLRAEEWCLSLSHGTWSRLEEFSVAF